MLWLLPLLQLLRATPLLFRVAAQTVLWVFTSTAAHVLAARYMVPSTDAPDSALGMTAEAPAPSDKHMGDEPESALGMTEEVILQEAPAPRDKHEGDESDSASEMTEEVILQEAPAPPDNHKGVGRNTVMCLVLPFVFGIVVFGVMITSRWSAEDAPIASLRYFAERESSRHGLESFKAMTVDSMHVYANAACVKGEDFEHVKVALRKQLRRIPGGVVDGVIDSALSEFASTMNSEHDTVTGIEGSGQAHSYLAFWNTRYDPGNGILPALYSTCVAISGVDITVGEDVAEWVTTEELEAVATKPCECLFMFCKQCPVMATKTTRKPIFKRHRLTLKDQEDLHQWMVKKAVGEAKSLITAHNAKQSILGNIFAKPDVPKAIGWDKPEPFTYLGDDEALPKDALIEKGEL